MSNIKRTEKFLPTLPPQSASIEVREWLREEFDRIASSSNASLAAIDALRAIPRMFLAGQCDDFNLDTIDSPLINYTQDAVIGVVPVEPDPVLGTITVPFDGLYNIVAYVYGLQPSIVQNVSIRLLVDIDGLNVPVASLDVNSNQTDDRSLSASITRSLDAGNVMRLEMDCTGDVGVFNIFQVSFEVTLVQSVDDADLSRITWFP